MDPRQLRSDCLLNYGLEIFGDRWSLLIIRDLMFFGKRYYNEFIASTEGISTSVLAARLEFLEKENIICAVSDPSHKQKIRYCLTEKGIDLLPVIIEIGFWSDKHAKGLNPETRKILDVARKDKAAGIRMLKRKLREEHLSGY